MVVRVRRRLEVEPTRNIATVATVLGALALIRSLRPVPVPTISDRRVFDFERPVRSAYVSVGPRSAARLVARPDARRVVAKPYVPPYVGFLDPRRVDLCRRREVRKRMMHATRYAGGGGFKRRRRDPWSEVRC